MSTIQKGVLSMLTLSLALGLALIKRVKSDDMAPTITAGDWVAVVPWSKIQPGDVVRLDDPSDPQQPILRRVLATGGQSITIAEGHIRVEKRRLRAVAMGDSGDYLVAKETLWAKKPAVGASWLTRSLAEPSSRWRAEAVKVPQGHLYLMADDRDGPPDSRWWGPVPLSAIDGIVRVRVGTAHTWRPSFELLAGSPAIKNRG
jgi:signal peptidase I